LVEVVISIDDGGVLCSGVEILLLPETQLHKSTSIDIYLGIFHYNKKNKIFIINLTINIIYVILLYTL